MKPNTSLFVLLSIVAQLASIPVLYGFFELITSTYGGAGIDIEFFFLKFPQVNYIIIFSTIIVTSIRETTKSELLASVMHMAWILFIWTDTHHFFGNLPVEYIIFILCLVLTIPIRLLFQRRFLEADSV